VAGNIDKVAEKHGERRVRESRAVASENRDVPHDTHLNVFFLHKYFALFKGEAMGEKPTCT
jgi:hypothetical protein